MGNVRENFVLFLIVLLVVSSPIMAKTALAQTTPAPSVPQFTLKFVNASYNVTTTNPYTGVNTTAQVDNSSLSVTIKNQAFDYGDNYHLFYDVRIKPHFSENWTELSPTMPLFSGSNLTLAQYISDIYYSNNSHPESDSTYTTLSISASGYPSGGQIDFQVATEVGINSTFYSIHTIGSVPIGAGQTEPAIAYVTTSDWSNTQTITTPASSISAAATPALSPASAAPEFPTWTIPIILVLMAVAFFMLFNIRKRKLINSSK